MPLIQSRHLHGRKFGPSWSYFLSSFLGSTVHLNLCHLKSSIPTGSRLSTFQSRRKAYMPGEDYSHTSSISIQAAISVRKNLNLQSLLKACGF
jgi:hypothetical protein